MQAAHSAQESGREFGNPTGATTHLILIGIKNENALRKISTDLTQLNIKHHMFYEPDYNRGYTSLTTEPLVERPAYFKKFSLYKYRAEKSFSQADEQKAKENINEYF